MTEPTEQQRRLIYEWLREELKGKNWFVALFDRDPVAVWGYNPEQGTFAGVVPLPPLDYNTFMAGAVPKLYGEGCSVIFKRLVTDSDYRAGYYKLIWGGYPEVIHEACNHDPWLAVIEYLGREK